MEPTELRAWCTARRGRLSQLARAADVSRQCVWQWLQGDRPIPADKVPLVRREMRRAERAA